MDLAQLSISIDSRDAVQAGDNLDKLTGAGQMAESMVKKLIAAWSSWKVIEYARDAATLAARYDTLGVVMGVVGNNAGYTRAQMEAFAAALQKGGISMVESRNSLAVMAQAHIDLAKSAQLARLAQDAAVVGNMNSSQAFHQLVEGIQTGRTEILRTIGINVNFEDSYKTLADSIGKSTDALSEQEKTTARTNAVLGKAKDLNGAYEAAMETSGKQLLSMTRYAEDLKTVFGTLFSDTFSIAIQAINHGLQDTKRWLTENTEAARTMNQMLGSAAWSFTDMVKQTLGFAGGMTHVNEQLSLGEILAGGLALSMAVVRDFVVNTIGAIEILWGTLSTIISGAVLGVAKLAGLVAAIKPPKWMEDFYNSSLDTWEKGSKHLGSSQTAALFSPDYKSIVAEAELDAAKRRQALKDEMDRMAAGGSTKTETKVSTKYLDLLKQENEALERQMILLSQGETAAYRFDLAKKGIKGKDQDRLVAQFQANSDQEAEDASAARVLQILDDQDKAYESLTNTLNPAAKMAREYADAVYQINLRETDGATKALLLKAAYDTMTPSGIAAAEAQKKLAQESKHLADEAARMNYQYANPTQQRAADMDHLNKLMGTGVLTQETYNRRMLEMDPIIGSLTQSMMNFGDSAADALAKWATGMDRSAIHWSDMIRSMLTDFARLTEKQGLNSLLGYVMDSLGGFWNGSGSGGGSSLGSDMSGVMGGDSYVPYPVRSTDTSTGTSNTSGRSIASNVVVTVNHNGAASSQVSTRGAAAALGTQFEAAINNVIAKNLRPGGLLNHA